MSNVWRVNGTCARIGFNGIQPFVSGYNKTTKIEFLYGFKEYLPSDLDHVEVYWEIRPSDYKRLRSVFREHSQAVKEEPDSVHYTIRHYKTSDRMERSINFFIVIPKLLFETQFLMWKDFVFGNKQTKYTIALGVEEFLKAPSISKIEEYRKENPEPLRLYRRLQILRGLEHEQIKTIFPGDTGAGCSDGLRT